MTTITEEHIGKTVVLTERDGRTKQGTLTELIAPNSRTAQARIQIGSRNLFYPIDMVSLPDRAED